MGSMGSGNGKLIDEETQQSFSRMLRLDGLKMSRDSDFGIVLRDGVFRYTSMDF